MNKEELKKRLEKTIIAMDLEIVDLEIMSSRMGVEVHKVQDKIGRKLLPPLLETQTNAILALALLDRDGI